MILNAITEKLKRQSKDDFRGGSGNLHSGDKWNFCLTSA